MAFLHLGVNIRFHGSIIGSLKSPRGTSYRSSMDTVALNCLVFEKLAFFCILAIDMQTNRWTRPSQWSHEAAVAVASGGLIKQRLARLLDDCR